MHCCFHPQGMPPRSRTRYYPAVGPAIPRRWASSSRVTHPFATEPLRVPFDLHVLGTPPAFVLSQDQTLQRVFELLESNDLVCCSVRPNHLLFAE